MMVWDYPGSHHLAKAIILERNFTVCGLAWTARSSICKEIMGITSMEKSELVTPKHQHADTNVDVIILAKGSGIALLGKLGGRGIQLITYIVLGRLLGPTNYGLFVLGLTILQIGQQIGLMGLDNGVIQFGVRAWQQGTSELSRVLRHVQILTLVGGVMVGGFIFLSAPWLALSIFNEPQLVVILRGFAVAVVLAVELRVTSSATRVSQRMQFSVLTEDILPVLVNLVLVVVLVFGLKMSIQGAVISLGAGFGTGWVVSLLFIKKIFQTDLFSGSISWRLSRELLAFSIPTYFVTFLNLLLQGSTTLLIGYFLSPKDVGIYQVAVQISLLSAIILTGFNTIFAPMIPKLHQTGQLSQLNELFKVSTKWGLYISMPLFFAMVLMPQQVLELVYGSEYIDGARPLIILAIAQLINAGTGAVGYLLMMTRHQNRLLVLSILSLLVSFLLDLWFIPRWGITGAALASACGVSLFFLGALHQVRHLLRLWPYDIRYRKGLFAGILSMFVIVASEWVWPVPTVVTLVMQILMSVIVFCGVLLVQGIDDEDKKFLLAFRGVYYRIMGKAQS
jgi:O-antigen/teichoic acid export membrane protein